MQAGWLHVPDSNTLRSCWTLSLHASKAPNEASRACLIVGAVQESIIAGAGDEGPNGSGGLQLLHQDVRITVRVRQNAELLNGEALGFRS